MSDRTPQAITVRPAHPDELPAIAAMMTRAFDDEPYYRWLLGDDEHYAEHLRRFLDAGLAHYQAAASDLCTADGIPGAVDWQRHDDVPPGPGESRFAPLLDAILARTPLRMPRRRYRAAQVFARVHPRQPHYHLSGLTVEPALQGRSIGSQLLRPGLDRCDREGMPAYLETGRDDAVAFYERHGFAVMEALHLPGGGPLVRFMWREPRHSWSPSSP